MPCGYISGSKIRITCLFASCRQRISLAIEAISPGNELYGGFLEIKKLFTAAACRSLTKIPNAAIKTRPRRLYSDKIFAAVRFSSTEQESHSKYYSCRRKEKITEFMDLEEYILVVQENDPLPWQRLLFQETALTGYILEFLYIYYPDTLEETRSKRLKIRTIRCNRRRFHNFENKNQIEWFKTEITDY